MAQEKSGYNSKKLCEFDEWAALVGQITEWSFKLYDLEVLGQLRDNIRGKVIQSRKEFGRSQRENPLDFDDN